MQSNHLFPHLPVEVWCIIVEFLPYSSRTLQLWQVSQGFAAVLDTKQVVCESFSQDPCHHKWHMVTLKDGIANSTCIYCKCWLDEGDFEHLGVFCRPCAEQNHCIWRCTFCETGPMACVACVRNNFIPHSDAFSDDEHEDHGYACEHCCTRCDVCDQLCMNKLLKPCPVSTCKAMRCEYCCDEWVKRMCRVCGKKRSRCTACCSVCRRCCKTAL